MRILINAAVMIFDYKIKMKNDKTFTKAFIETFSKIFDESHVTFNDHSDEIKINQNLVFSSVNTIIAEKTIFVLNTIFQIIQLETVNSFLILIEHL